MLNMKVAFCTRESDNVSGGQNTWLCRFLPDLRRRGVEPRVLCFTSSAEKELPTIRSLRQSQIRCTVASQEKYKYTEHQVRWILEQLAEDPPDVFVANMVIPAAYYAGRWLRKAGIPTVGICHGGGMSEFYPGLLDEFVFGRAAYKISAYVCISRYLEDDVLSRRPNGILIRRIPYGLPIPKIEVKRPNEKLRVVYVGQLVEERKRISELTHALCRAAREVPGTEAWIYGDGPDRGIIEEILREQDDGLPVHLAGFVENDQMRKELRKCHVVVLLSDHEGLGLALLEGMACAVVPIALRGAPGVTEFVLDNVTGILVDDRGDSFVAAVRRLRQDQLLWERLARSARAHVENHYSEEICIGRWQELLSDLVTGSTSRKLIRIPRAFDLPPVHASLAVMDERAPLPAQQLIRQARHLVNWLLKA